jgi:imidazolonepropionase-like amidohydrolase
VRRALLVISLAALPAAALAQGVVAIENATVYADPKTKIEGATVVIKDGVISAIGPGVAVPAGATRIDGKGKIVTAGLIDSASQLGLSEVALVPETVEGVFGSGRRPVHAAYRVLDGYNPSSIAIPVARTGGVTAVGAMPAGGLVAGAAAMMSLKAGEGAEALAISPSLAMVAALGEGSLGSADGSRGVAVEELRELLDDAAQYAKRKDAFEKNQTRPFAASRLDLEALIPVVQGRLPLAVRVGRAADIRVALKLAQDLKLKLVILGGAEAWQLAPELARAKVPVVLDPTANLPDSFDVIHVRDDGAKILAEAGVPVVISTLGEAADVRRLRQYAGIAVSHGLSWEAAFAAITKTPAEAFGLKGRGSLEAGAAADLVVWSGDPLELSSRAERVFIGGVEQPSETHQSLLLKRYKAPGAK